jgi:ATP-dependent Lon protease
MEKKIKACRHEQGGPGQGQRRGQEAQADVADVGRGDRGAQLHRNPAGLPWKKKSRISKDLGAAEKVLDKDHYGLEKVKERIVEYLAVQQRVDKVKAPILCLVGPPGVGKTSLGQSIAKATNRKFIRMALGGVRDEAEIRGHRRTYIGSMPGKILQNMSKVGVKNPLFLLDEVDKMGQDFRGDPSSALLEVLDPEQNHTFQDHYIEVDFDLSDVMFVATANTLNIPAALLDRMEVIRLCRLHRGRESQHRTALPLPKQMKNNGIKRDELSVTEDALRDIVRYYTREAGVRSPGARDLEDLPQGRQIAGDEGAQEQDRGQRQEPRQVPRRAPVQLRHGREGKPGRPGHRSGMDRGRRRTADHRTGALPGKGKTMTTGKLGEVMQESIQAALSVVVKRSRRWVLPMTSTRRTTSTSTCPKARRRRMARVPASPSDGAGVGADRYSGACRRGDDGRDHPARRGACRSAASRKSCWRQCAAASVLALIPEENVKDLAEIPDTIKNRSRSCRSSGSTRCSNWLWSACRAAARCRRRNTCGAVGRAMPRQPAWSPTKLC